MHKTLLHTALICVCAFLGGFASEQLFRPGNSFAQMLMPEHGRYSASDPIIVNDMTGRKRLDIDAPEGYPIQDFYGHNGTLRLQLGTYSGQEGPGSDAGLPLVSLSDTQGRLRLLVRINKGVNQSPLLIMKDSKGKDRIIMGTDLQDADEEPFMVYLDKFGAKHSVFGHFN